MNTAPAPAADDGVETFRGEVRRWCDHHVPKGWRKRETEASAEVRMQHEWQASLASAGYFAPHWPKEFGGAELELPKQVALAEELARADAPRLALYQVAVYNSAPAILHHGTAKQKRRFLGGIRTGEVWCQGFSEPNAGSDLAALSTRAERHGDVYVLNGQKVWTSWAMYADWCIVLARTDAAAPKRHGLSFLLMDMATPGVQVRPIVQSTGVAEFSELFLTDVEVPAENLVGAENDGWRVSQSTLASERAVTLLELVERLHHNGIRALIEAAAGWTGEDGEPILRDRATREQLGGLYGEVQILRSLCADMIRSLTSRGGIGAESSIAKVAYSELLQRLMRTAVNMRGLPAQVASRPLMSAGWETGDWLSDFIGSWSWTIAGGTNEIQRNIIGEQYLGLPREPRAAEERK